MNRGDGDQNPQSTTTQQQQPSVYASLAEEWAAMNRETIPHGQDSTRGGGGEGTLDPSVPPQPAPPNSYVPDMQEMEAQAQEYAAMTRAASGGIIPPPQGHHHHNGATTPPASSDPSHTFRGAQEPPPLSPTLWMSSSSPAVAANELAREWTDRNREAEAAFGSSSNVHSSHQGNVAETASHIGAAPPFQFDVPHMSSSSSSSYAPQPREEAPELPQPPPSLSSKPIGRHIPGSAMDNLAKQWAAMNRERAGGGEWKQPQHPQRGGTVGTGSANSVADLAKEWAARNQARTDGTARAADAVPSALERIAAGASFAPPPNQELPPPDTAVPPTPPQESEPWSPYHNVHEASETAETTRTGTSPPYSPAAGGPSIPHPVLGGPATNDAQSYPVDRSNMIPPPPPRPAVSSSNKDSVMDPRNPFDLERPFDLAKLQPELRKGLMKHVCVGGGHGGIRGRRAVMEDFSNPANQRDYEAAMSDAIRREEAAMAARRDPTNADHPNAYGGALGDSGASSSTMTNTRPDANPNDPPMAVESPKSNLFSMSGPVKSEVPRPGQENRAGPQQANLFAVSGPGEPKVLFPEQVVKAEGEINSRDLFTVSSPGEPQGSGTEDFGRSESLAGGRRDPPPSLDGPKEGSNLFSVSRPDEPQAPRDLFSVSGPGGETLADDELLPLPGRENVAGPQSPMPAGRLRMQSSRSAGGRGDSETGTPPMPGIPGDHRMYSESGQQERGKSAVDAPFSPPSDSGPPVGRQDFERPDPFSPQQGIEMPDMDGLHIPDGPPLDPQQGSLGWKGRRKSIPETREGPEGYPHSWDTSQSDVPGQYVPPGMGDDPISSRSNQRPPPPPLDPRAHPQGEGMPWDSPLPPIPEEEGPRRQVNHQFYSQQGDSPGHPGGLSPEGSMSWDSSIPHNRGHSPHERMPMDSPRQPPDSSMGQGGPSFMEPRPMTDDPFSVSDEMPGRGGPRGSQEKYPPPEGISFDPSLAQEHFNYGQSLPDRGQADNSWQSKGMPRDDRGSQYGNIDQPLPGMSVNEDETNGWISQEGSVGHAHTDSHSQERMGGQPLDSRSSKQSLDGGMAGSRSNHGQSMSELPGHERWHDGTLGVTSPEPEYGVQSQSPRKQPSGPLENFNATLAISVDADPHSLNGHDTTTIAQLIRTTFGQGSESDAPYRQVLDVQYLGVLDMKENGGEKLGFWVSWKAYEETKLTGFMDRLNDELALAKFKKRSPKKKREPETARPPPQENVRQKEYRSPPEQAPPPMQRTTEVQASQESAFSREKSVEAYPAVESEASTGKTEEKHAKTAHKSESAEEWKQIVKQKMDEDFQRHKVPGVSPSKTRPRNYYNATLALSVETDPSLMTSEDFNVIADAIRATLGQGSALVDEPPFRQVAEVAYIGIFDDVGDSPRLGYWISWKAFRETTLDSFMERLYDQLATAPLSQPVMRKKKSSSNSRKNNSNMPKKGGAAGPTMGRKVGNKKPIPPASVESPGFASMEDEMAHDATASSLKSKGYVGIPGFKSLFSRIAEEQSQKKASDDRYDQQDYGQEENEQSYEQPEYVAPHRIKQDSSVHRQAPPEVKPVQTEAERIAEEKRLAEEEETNRIEEAARSMAKAEQKFVEDSRAAREARLKLEAERRAEAEKARRKVMRMSSDYFQDELPKVKPEHMVEDAETRRKIMGVPGGDTNDQQRLEAQRMAEEAEVRRELMGAPGGDTDDQQRLEAQRMPEEAKVRRELMGAPGGDTNDQQRLEAQRMAEEAEVRRELMGAPGGDTNDQQRLEAQRMAEEAEVRRKLMGVPEGNRHENNQLEAQRRAEAAEAHRKLMEVSEGNKYEEDHLEAERRAEATDARRKMMGVANSANENNQLEERRRAEAAEERRRIMGISSSNNNEDARLETDRSSEVAEARRKIIGSSNNSNNHEDARLEADRSVEAGEARRKIMGHSSRSSNEDAKLDMDHKAEVAEARRKMFGVSNSGSSTTEESPADDTEDELSESHKRAQSLINAAAEKRAAEARAKAAEEAKAEEDRIAREKFRQEAAEARLEDLARSRAKGRTGQRPWGLITEPRYSLEDARLSMKYYQREREQQRKTEKKKLGTTSSPNDRLSDLTPGNDAQSEKGEVKRSSDLGEPGVSEELHVAASAAEEKVLPDLSTIQSSLDENVSSQLPPAVFNDTLDPNLPLLNPVENQNLEDRVFWGSNHSDVPPMTPFFRKRTPKLLTSAPLIVKDFNATLAFSMETFSDLVSPDDTEIISEAIQSTFSQGEYDHSDPSLPKVSFVENLGAVDVGDGNGPQILCRVSLSALGETNLDGLMERLNSEISRVVANRHLEQKDDIVEGEVHSKAESTLNLSKTLVQTDDKEIQSVVDHKDDSFLPEHGVISEGVQDIAGLQIENRLDSETGKTEDVVNDLLEQGEALELASQDGGDDTNESETKQDNNDHVNSNESDLVSKQEELAELENKVAQILAKEKEIEQLEKRKQSQKLVQEKLERIAQQKEAKKLAQLKEEEQAAKLQEAEKMVSEQKEEELASKRQEAEKMVTVQDLLQEKKDEQNGKQKQAQKLAQQKLQIISKQNEAKKLVRQKEERVANVEEAETTANLKDSEDLVVEEETKVDVVTAKDTEDLVMEEDTKVDEEDQELETLGKCEGMEQIEGGLEVVDQEPSNLENGSDIVEIFEKEETPVLAEEEKGKCEDEKEIEAVVEEEEEQFPERNDVQLRQTPEESVQLDVDINAEDDSKLPLHSREPENTTNQKDAEIRARKIEAESRQRSLLSARLQLQAVHPVQEHGENEKKTVLKQKLHPHDSETTGQYDVLDDFNTLADFSFFHFLRNKNTKNPKP